MSGKRSYLVDTNVLLRYLVNDHAEHGLAAKRLIDEAGMGKIDLQIPFVTVMETIYTLKSFYRLPQADISRELLKVLTAPGIKITGAAWILEAVQDFRNEGVSFGDACLAAQARNEGLTIASFDRGIESFPGVRRYEPR